MYKNRTQICTNIFGIIYLELSLWFVFKTYVAYGIMSADLSFMDLLFDKEDPLITFDKDIKTEDLKYKTISVSAHSIYKDSIVSVL